MSVVVERQADGTVRLRSTHDLGPYPEKITERLDHWARHASYRTFLAERDEHGRWRNVTYAEAQYFARRIGQALLNRGLSVEHPIVILSGNDIEHALLGIAAMYAGVPYASLPAAYSLASSDFSELHHIFKLIAPGLVFVADGLQVEHALRQALPSEAELVVNENPVPGATMFADLVNTEPHEAIDHVHSHVQGNTVCKLLFTPLTGGMPGGAVITHSMGTSNQEMLRHFLPFLKDEPPVLVDRSPWSDAIGSTNFGLVLYNGGSLYIDHEEEGLRNLRVLAPTLHCPTPKAFEAMAPHLREDSAFRKHFLSRLKAFCCSEGIQDSSLPFVETRQYAETGVVLMGGLPVPGVELKLVPSDAGKFEARVRGPNVTYGYWRRLEPTRAAFDEEGFFKLEEEFSRGSLSELDPLRQR
jgi:feruloyl-CoA synthase